MAETPPTPPASKAHVHEWKAIAPIGATEYADRVNEACTGCEGKRWNPAFAGNYHEYARKLNAKS